MRDLLSGADSSLDVGLVLIFHVVVVIYRREEGDFTFTTAVDLFLEAGYDIFKTIFCQKWRDFDSGKMTSPSH